jgi:ankyrin repeat protein
MQEIHRMDRDLKLKEAFVVAARNGQTEIMGLLLEAGVDIHAWKDVALRVASEAGQTKAVRLLLRKGADAHAMNDEALRLAEEQGHQETAALLRKRSGKSASGPRSPGL